MKITKNYLKQVIAEELQKLSEGPMDDAAEKTNLATQGITSPTELSAYRIFMQDLKTSMINGSLPAEKKAELFKKANTLPPKVKDIVIKLVS